MKFFVEFNWECIKLEIFLDVKKDDLRVYIYYLRFLVFLIKIFM